MIEWTSDSNDNSSNLAVSILFKVESFKSQVGLLSLVNSKEEVHAQEVHRKMARRRESMRIRMHAVRLITSVVYFDQFLVH